MVSAVPRAVADAASALESKQAAYLRRIVPDHRIRRLRWSGGSTQVIESGEGQPLLLLHGGLGEAFQWAPLMPALARHSRVLAVDRPGHGLADPFDYRGLDLLEFGARFVVEILDALELKSAALVGNSMGGLWATGCALQHPERIPRLVLVGSPAGVQRAVPWGLRLGTLPLLRRAVSSAMSRATADSVRAFWKLLVVHPERLDQDFLELSAASQLRNYPSWMTMLSRALDIRGIKPNLMLEPRWGRLQMPTTLVWGEQDQWSPPETGDAIAASHPRIRMIRVPNAGHAPWFDDCEAVARGVQLALS